MAKPVEYRNAVMVVKSAEGRRSRLSRLISDASREEQRDRLERAGIKRIPSFRAILSKVRA